MADNNKELKRKDCCFEYFGRSEMAWDDGFSIEISEVEFTEDRLWCFDGQDCSIENELKLKIKLINHHSIF